MQSGQIIDAEIGEQDGSEADDRHDRHALSPPAPDEAGMKHDGVNDPGNQGPRFLWIPAPVGAPGEMGPDGSCQDAHGQKNKPQDDALIDQSIQSIR